MTITVSGVGRLNEAVIDAHAHCGVIDRSMPQSFEDYRQQVAGTDIGGVDDICNCLRFVLIVPIKQKEKAHISVVFKDLQHVLRKRMNNPIGFQSV